MTSAVPERLRPTKRGEVLVVFPDLRARLVETPDTLLDESRGRGPLWLRRAAVRLVRWLGATRIAMRTETTVITRRRIADDIQEFAGRAVTDAMNYYDLPPTDLVLLCGHEQFGELQLILARSGMVQTYYEINLARQHASGYREHWNGVALSVCPTMSGLICVPQKAVERA